MMKTGILFAALFAAVAACAQGAAPEDSGQSPAANAPWTLDDCIGFAQRNNIDVQRRTLQVEKSDVDLSTAKYSRLPDLNASVGADASFGRVLSSDNTYQTKNQTSGSLNVSASMPLFQGMRINHRIKAGKLDLAAAVQDMERAREDVAINVMTLYLEVLYNKEMVGVAERQLTLSEQQAGRSRALAAAGKQPESAVYESDALAAGSRMTLTQARNDLQLALLDLSQALNRESAAGFDIVAPALDSMDLAALHRLGSADEVYAYAAENRPHIRAERLRLESSEHAVAVARSALYPSLSLSGGYGTGGLQRRQGQVLGPDTPLQPRIRGALAQRSDLQPPGRAQRHPHGADRRAQPAAGRHRGRTRAAQTDRTGVVQRRRLLRQIPLGRSRSGIGPGRLRLRGAESRSGPLDRVRLQRRQNAHGEGRSRGRAGQIRIRIPFENTRFLPRETADALKKPARNKQFETNRATRKGRPIAIRDISPNKIPDGFR